jgi:hypothetical protein
MLRLSSTEQTYLKTILQVSWLGKHPWSAESVLVSALLIGLRVVCADALSRMAPGEESRGTFLCDGASAEGRSRTTDDAT